MAAKKKTTKKKVTRKPTARKKPQVENEYKSHDGAIDLDVKTPEQAANIIAHLKQLQMTAGWLIMKQMLELNMAALEKGIVKKVDPITLEALTDDEIEGMRNTYNVYEELLGKPEQLITLFTAEKSTGVPAYDPYAQSMEPSKEEYAGVLEEQ